MAVCIVGWAHSRFGRHEGVDVEALVAEAAAGAIEDAGVAPADVDEILLGHFNGGLAEQGFPSSLVLQAHPDLRFKPATRVENACATGSAAVFQGLNAIDAGRARIVLCVGAEKMTGVAGDAVGPILARACYVKEEGEAHGSFVDVFAGIAEAYFRRHGDQSDALARIAAKNHANGARNPLAHLRKDLGYEFCRRPSDGNPVVSGPLKRSDCSPVTDGAAAVVLADVGTAMAMGKAVLFRAAAHVNDYLPMSRRDVTRFEGPAEALRRAYGQAGVTVDDLDLAEVHDCFTIAELLIYEAMGLAAEGEGARAVADGHTEMGGRLPVNPSGGLKSKGHPIGATGVSMHVLAAMQTRGDAGPLQVPGAGLAGVFNMGGAAVANYASVLEALR